MLLHTQVKMEKEHMEYSVPKKTAVYLLTESDLVANRQKPKEAIPVFNAKTIAVRKFGSRFGKRI